MFRSTLKNTGNAYLRMLATAFLLAASVQQAAAEQPAHFEMTAVSDAAYGDLVIDGEYRLAIGKILEEEAKADPFALNTNLCVAYTMEREFELARNACDVAVEISLTEGRIRGTVAQGTSRARELEATRQSVAYSNRGMLMLATGEREAAQDDLEQAAALHTPLRSAKRNLARMNSQQTVSTL